MIVSVLYPTQQAIRDVDRHETMQGIDIAFQESGIFATLSDYSSLRPVFAKVDFFNHGGPGELYLPIIQNDRQK